MMYGLTHLTAALDAQSRSGLACEALERFKRLPHPSDLRFFCARNPCAKPDGRVERRNKRPLCGNRPGAPSWDVLVETRLTHLHRQPGPLLDHKEAAMPDADEPKQPSAAIAHDALLTLLFDLYRSTERLADCLGVSVACHQGRMPLDVVNTETFVPDMAEIGFGEANHHLALLDRLCEQLHIPTSSVAQGAPRERARIRLEYPEPRTPHV